MKINLYPELNIFRQTLLNVFVVALYIIGISYWPVYKYENIFEHAYLLFSIIIFTYIFLTSIMKILFIVGDLVFKRMSFIGGRVKSLRYLRNRGYGEISFKVNGIKFKYLDPNRTKNFKIILKKKNKSKLKYYTFSKIPIEIS